MMPAAHLLTSLAAGLALCAGIAFTALTARIDWLVERSRDPRDTARACRLLSVHAPCLATLARQKEELGFAALPDWQRAQKREPYDTRLNLALALSFEAAGQAPETEAMLRHAAAIDRGWLPRWTLASYHYRRQNWTEFWTWTREAVTMAPTVPEALFRLCLSATPDAAAAADQCLGQASTRWLPSFIEFAAREQPAAGFAALAARLQPVADAPTGLEHRPRLLRAAETLLRSGQPASAHALWRRMGALGLLPYPAWSAASPLANPGLAPPVDPPAFDWRIYRLEGLETLAGAPPGSLKFTFSGQQAESIPLIEQWVWMPAGPPRRLVSEFRARSLEPGAAGLHWRWLDGAGRLLASSPPPDPDENWKSWSFDMPGVREPGLYKLVLWAARPSGLTRLRGEAWVRNVTLTAETPRPRSNRRMESAP